MSTAANASKPAVHGGCVRRPAERERNGASESTEHGGCKLFAPPLLVALPFHTAATWMLNCDAYPLPR